MEYTGLNLNILKGKWFQNYILFAVLLMIQWINANFRQDN
jgi:hypothetical protein